MPVFSIAEAIYKAKTFYDLPESLQLVLRKKYGESNALLLKGISLDLAVIS